MLKKMIAISKYFFQKNLKDIISFSIILLIATTLFSSAFIINNNISKDYDKEFEKLNTASAFFTIPKTEYEDVLLEEIRNIEKVKEAQAQRGIMLSVSVDMDGSMQEQTQIFYNIDDISNINKRKIIQKSTNQETLGIYLSNYTYIHSKIKDKYGFTINHIPYTFYIKGVVSEMQYGNYTSSVIGEYLENESYEYLLQNNQEKEVITISLVSDDSFFTYQNLSKYFSRKNITVLNKNYKEQAKNGRLAISNIIVFILMVFASSMLMISLFVSKFKIEQTIEEEITNMGALESLGYTSNEIIIASILPYIISGLLFTLFGIVASYLVLPMLSQIIEMQSGFKWKVILDLSSNVFVLLINFILITIFTLTASYKMKKQNPINAMRGLTEKTNHKNHFKIEKTAGNIHFILMLKNFIHTKKQNILLGIVLFLITIVSSFIGILFYNINMYPINFVSTLVEEHPSVIISSTKDLREELKRQDNVKNVFYYDENATLNYQDNSYKTFVAESFDDLENDLCYEGRNPKNRNEVALGSKIKELYDIHIGDDIILSKNGEEETYQVVGFIQSVNYSGEVIEITLDGYKKLEPSYLPNIMYVYLEKEDYAKEFIDEIKRQYQDDILSTINYVESLNSAMNMYVSLISTICVVMIVISLFLIYLILYIVISSIITKRKQELGILKAIGYENKELVKQLVGAFLPSVVFASFLGFIVSNLFMSNIYTMVFKGVGAYKVSFEYPLIVFLIITLFLIISTLVIATIRAKKIKNISVYSLIKD